MVQVADVVSEKLSSTETSLATSAVGRMAALSWALCRAVPWTPAPSAQRAEKQTSTAFPLSGSVLSLVWWKEPEVAYRNLIALEHSEVNQGHPSVFRNLILVQKNASLKTKCFLPRKLPCNPAASSTVMLVSLQGVTWLNLWVTSWTYIHSTKLRRVCSKDSPSSSAVSMGQPRVSQKQPLDL